MTKENGDVLDVLIIGAGISGIDAAYRLQTECPGKSYAILEARDRLGGTWDLFRYPGVRSDSDVETLGFPFRPWTKERSIAEGASIREYVKDTAREFGIDRKIRFGWKATEARWSSADAEWTVAGVAPEGQAREIRCRFLLGCTGYYNYGKPYRPEFPGQESFRGQWIHPQFWPETYDPAGKRIVLIGSGATAVTILPALAGKAERVTMLQRSPSYVAAVPSVDPISRGIRRIFPRGLAHRLVRFKNICVGIFIFQFSKRYPHRTRRFLMRLARRALPPEIDVNRDFNPRYNPWDQRLCISPDGDFFAALRSGRAGVVTDEIDRFEEKGIRLRSGAFLEADTVVTATGLELLLLGGMKLYKDGAEVALNQLFQYKGVMFSDVPNFAVAIGYTNATWTLKCDLSARYVCRLIRYMDEGGFRVVCPVVGEPIEAQRLLNLDSGYIRRSEAILPRQGSRRPWRLHQNYFFDWLDLGWSAVRDGSLKFSKD